MKVFFTASQRGKKDFGKYYNVIYTELEKLGYHHVDGRIISDKADELINTKEKATDIYENNIKNIKSADIVIFEGSCHSLSIGFMIQKALEANKPVVLLFLKGHMPFFLSGLDSEKLVLVEYTEESLKKTIDKAVEQTKPLIDTRFNFFISPKLLSYLQKVSKDQGITKSAFIRNLIIKHMKEGN